MAEAEYQPPRHAGLAPTFVADGEGLCALGHPGKAVLDRDELCVACWRVVVLLPWALRG